MTTSRCALHPTWRFGPYQEIGGQSHQSTRRYVIFRLSTRIEAAMALEILQKPSLLYCGISSGQIAFQASLAPGIGVAVSSSRSGTLGSGWVLPRSGMAIAFCLSWSRREEQVRLHRLVDCGTVFQNTDTFFFATRSLEQYLAPRSC